MGGGGGGEVDAGAFEDGGSNPNALDGGALDGGALPEKVIRPLYFGTADQPVPASAADDLNALFGAMNLRFEEEMAQSLQLAPAIVHQSAKSCAELGANAVAQLGAVAQELAPDGNSKFQVVLPCDDPTGQAAGIAYVGGHVAVTFDGSKRLGQSSARAYLSAVAMHELGHNLGLVHNSVGNNCMGPVELRSFALGLLGDSETAACVFLPHQRTRVTEVAPAFVRAVSPSSFNSGAPGLVATPTKVGNAWQVSLVWVGSASSNARGWHVERDGVRILRVAPSSNSDTDGDGANEYHDDPQMTDPGLETGKRYCYRVRQYDASGTEGPVGAESCVQL